MDYLNLLIVVLSPFFRCINYCAEIKRKKKQKNDDYKFEVRRII